MDEARRVAGQSKLHYESQSTYLLVRAQAGSFHKSIPFFIRIDGTI
jgi:hypothetical protein